MTKKKEIHISLTLLTYVITLFSDDIISLKRNYKLDAIIKLTLLPCDMTYPTVMNI